MLSDVQELLSAEFIRRKAEPKYGHTAIPYKSPPIRTRQKHYIGFCNPVSVPFIACRWDEFNWRLVTSLYLKKKKSQNHNPKKITQSKIALRTQMYCHKHRVDF